MIDTTTLQDNIIADLTVELQSDDSFNADILAVKVAGAIRDVINRRNYRATALNDNAVLSDLESFYQTIEDLARYDYNQTGAEGQTGHNENGINRTWASRDTILKPVHAFCGCLY